MSKDGTAPRAGQPEYWLIARHGFAGVDVLTIETRRGEALAIFSFEDEALLFLSLEKPGPGWRAKKTTPGELASVLLRLPGGVGRVALDPLPGVIDRDMVCLVSLERGDFVRTLVRGPRARAARASGPCSENQAGENG